jgi:hypothetical protein
MSTRSKASSGMLQMHPSRGFGHAIGSSVAAWVLGSALLLLLTAVVFILPEPSPFQQGVVRFMLALTGALLSYFFCGGLTFRAHKAGIVVAGSSGFVLFIFLLTVINPFDVRTTIANFAPSALPGDKTILQAQEALKIRGLYHGDITGRPDTPTRNAIKQFQAENHLPADGFADAVTFCKLINTTEYKVRASGRNELPQDPQVKGPMISEVASNITLPSVPKKGCTIPGSAQLSYADAKLELTVIRDGLGSEEAQITLSALIQNNSNESMRLALMSGMSLEFDTGLSFTRPTGDATGVSGISYCDSLSENLCVEESNVMVLLRPKGQLRAEIRFVQKGLASDLDRAQSARFSGRLYTQSIRGDVKSIQRIELDRVDLIYVTSPRVAWSQNQVNRSPTL